MCKKCKRNDNKGSIELHDSKDALWVFVFVGLVLSCAAICLLFVHIHCKDVAFVWNLNVYKGFIDIIELVIAIVGICVSIYFVLVGIDVYKMKKEVENTLQGLSSFTEIDWSSQDEIFNIYSTLISLERMHESDKTVAEIQKMLNFRRSLLGCKLKVLEKDIRENAIAMLCENCSSRADYEEALKCLYPIVYDTKEDLDIIRVAENAQKEITEKLREMDSNNSKDNDKSGVNSQKKQNTGRRTVKKGKRGR